MTSYESHTDDQALATGTHKGASSAGSLAILAGDFRTWGIVVGSAIYNDTQGTDGLITAITEKTITDDTNSWDYGDTYSIYKTATKDSNISRNAIDRSRGWKVTRPEELDETGWLPKDHDLDIDSGNRRLQRGEVPWGPGQPKRRGRD